MKTTLYFTLTLNFRKCFNAIFSNPKRPCRDLLCWAILFTSVFQYGCAPYKLERKLIEPSQFPILDSKSPFLKAHTQDGRVYILSSWKVDLENQRVTGQGELLNANREILETGELTIPIDSVAIFETNTQHIISEMVIGGVVAGGALFISLLSVVYQMSQL